MTDFFEIDFLDVETTKSGDAIALRYAGHDGKQTVHVVDAGYQSTGSSMVDHIRKYYGTGSVDHVVATHNDGDHAGGLREVLETCEVGKLWMLCPWHYAGELIDRFQTYNSVERLVARLKEAYPNLAALEEIAQRRGIEIGEPFQGTQIGAFLVLAPSKNRFLELVLNSEKTPQATAQHAFFGAVREGVMNAASAVAYSRIATKYISASWGVEIFSSEGTRCENEMSIVQYANLCDQRILLTGDVGRDGLTEAADFADAMQIALPGIDKFQVPHHGSRRNVSSDILDRWLGPRLPAALPPGESHFVGMISSAKEDEAHPRKAVVRAIVHRGGRATATEGSSTLFHKNGNFRNWGPAVSLEYPWTQEEE
jgi:beta-lactamase superfamily II metal-dependent hydrolase